MSRVIRKPTFCICEIKGTDQLCRNCSAYQCFCFCYIDSTMCLTLPNFKPYILSHLLWLHVWDLVGNPEDRFSCDEAHIELTFRISDGSGSLSPQHAMESTAPN